MTDSDRAIGLAQRFGVCRSHTWGPHPSPAGQGSSLAAATVECGVSTNRGPTRRAPPTRHAMGDSPADITLLLRAAASGERRDLDALMVAIYDDMRRLALSHMRRERDNHTLQPTAVVHEAYVKLVNQRTTDWKDRLHFFSVASGIIRRILIDHARERDAEKRGGGRARVDIGDHQITAPMQSVDLIALDQALKELAEIDERQSKIVELRFFGGCTLDEIADLMKTGRRTLDRDWQAAKAWLLCRLEGDDPERSHA